VLAGTLYLQNLTVRNFALLCLALVLTAGARPEGKLFLAFGVLLVFLLHARSWRADYPRLVVIVLVAAGTHLATKTSQAGLLLYTSVARLTPDQMRVAPGFEPYIAAERAALERRWQEAPLFPNVADRRVIDQAVTQYLKEHPERGEAGAHRTVNDFCLKLAAETCRRNLGYLPIHAFAKFRATATEPPSGAFDGEWLFTHQHTAYRDDTGRMVRLSKGLIGESKASTADLDRFVDEHFREVPWFNAWQANWFSAVSAIRLPDASYLVHGKAGSYWHLDRGLPVYFVLAGLGLLASILRPGRLRRLHLAWAPTLAGVFFVVMLTANAKPRFRLVFEPFWWLYVAFLLDCAVLLLRHLVKRLHASRAGA
jgi:hypothetical protein